MLWVELLCRFFGMGGRLRSILQRCYESFLAGGVFKV
jgi:hypothetical protein